MRKRPCGTGSRFRTAVAVAVASSVAGCFHPLNVSPLQSSADELAAAARQWEKYGAYYQTDEVVASYDYSYLFNTVRTTYTVHKVIRILTTMGARCGTVIVPRFFDYDKISEFRVKLNDVRMDEDKIKAGYIESGKIVVPNVTAGCVIDLTVEFLDEQFIPVGPEHWFSRDIPVLHGRFSILLGNLGAYEYREYGTRCKLARKGDSTASRRTVEWRADHLEPRGEAQWQEWQDETEPRVVIALRHHPFIEQSEKYRTWSDISTHFRTYYQDAGLISGIQVRSIVKKLMRNAHDTISLADSIYQWTMHNITPVQTDFKITSLNRVLDSGKGNCWEIACVLNELFRAAGIASDVVITRSREDGGFDSSFVTFTALDMPMPLVTGHGRKYLADPRGLGSALGEYPSSYFGLYGLDVSNNTLVRLPEPVSRIMGRNQKISLDFSSDTAIQRLTIRYSDYWAYRLRHDLGDKGEDGRRKWIEDVVQGFEGNNSLVTYAFAGLDKPGAPIELTATFKREGALYAGRESGLHFTLHDYWRDHFAGIDSQRVCAMSSSLPVEDTESILIGKVRGKTVKVDFKPPDGSTSLFDCSSSKSEGAEGVTLSRIIRIRPALLPVEEVRKIIPAIRKLNSVKETSIVIR